MARRKTDPEALIKWATAVVVAAEPVKRARAKKLATPRSKEEARAELIARALDLWESAMMVDATPAEFVAVYTVMYARIYGVECMDMVVEAKRAAAQQAVKRLIADHLSGPEECAEYMAWVFQREFKRARSFEKQKKENPWRLSWNQLFLPGRVLEDYLLTRLKTG